MKKLASISCLIALCAALAFAVEVPRQAPDVSISLPDGKKAKISDFRGHPLIVMFMLTTCPHCQKTTRVLTGIYKDYQSKGVRVLEAAFNDYANAGAFAQEYQIPYAMGTTDRDTAMIAMQLSPMVRSFVPFMMFIDSSGTVRAEYTGSDPFLSDEGAQDKNIRGELDKLIAESSTTKHPARARKTTAKS